MTQRAVRRDSATLRFHLKFVAALFASVGLVACSALLVVLGTTSGGTGIGYQQIIAAYSIAGQKLQTGLLIFGLAAVALAGMLAGLIALYASFRVAGPLFRIARNLEQAVASRTAVMVPIRHGDQLQRQWKEFEASVQVLRHHYGDLREALAGADQTVGPDAVDLPRLRAVAGRLEETTRNVQL